MNQNAGGSFLSPETLDAIIIMFIEDAPGQMAGLRAALERQDHQALAQISHKLRGSTEFLGTSGISSLAAAVEHAAKHCDDGELAVQVPALIAEVQGLLDELQAAEQD